MKFRMSLRLVRCRSSCRSGSREPGLSSGGVHPARLGPQLIDLRLRPGRLDLLADAALELGDLGRCQTGSVGSSRAPGGIRAARRRAGPCASSSLARSRCWRDALLLARSQVDLVFGVVRICLDGRGNTHRGVPVAAARRVLPAPERARRRAPGGQHREQTESCRVYVSYVSRLSAHRESSGGALPSSYPDSRIVCRPRPSMYDSSTDSTPIRTMRYRPTMISPSLP